MLQKITNLELLRKLSLIVLLMFVAGLFSCAALETPKQKVTMSYSMYNSQFASYMTDTGYVMNNDGQWEKVTSPNIPEEKKEILRVKKEILTQMYPLIKLYDSMVLGLTPFSEATEAELFKLIDRLALLAE